MVKKIIMSLLLTLAWQSNAQLAQVVKNLDICAFDNETGLFWEVKSAKKGLQSAMNTYTWFDGKTGVENGKYSQNCNWGESCNTQLYIKVLNDIRLCGQDNWRLPSEAELSGLLKYGDDEVLIDKKIFPNTQKSAYWSADSIDEDIAQDVVFFYGGTPGTDKSFDGYIRAVSYAK
jgi:hypothetical protein